MKILTIYRRTFSNNLTTNFRTIQFVNQHIPDKQEAIQEKYHAVYLKRHQKLEEKIAGIVNSSPIAVEKDQKEKVA